MPDLLPLTQTNTSVHESAHTRTHYHKKNCNRILQLFQWLPSLSHTQLRALIHDKLSHLIHDKSSEGQIEMRKSREKKKRERWGGHRGKERDVREKERVISRSLEGSSEKEGSLEGWREGRKVFCRPDNNIISVLLSSSMKQMNTTL